MSIFWVQTDLPIGDPARGFTLRIVVEATCDATVGEMMRAVLDDRQLIGDHIELKPAEPGERVRRVFRRTPIAIPARRIVWLKPFAFELVEEVEAEGVVSAPEAVREATRAWR